MAAGLLVLISLHKNATTALAIRAAIQAASGSDYVLAEQFGVSRDTVRKWDKREGVHDASHTAHRLQTTLDAAQEELVAWLREHLLLTLDGLLVVVREFIEPAMSRSALDRLLRRRGCSQLPAPDAAKSPSQPFKAYVPGYVHVDVKFLPHMQAEASRKYAFVAIDRATRWVFVQIKRSNTSAAAKSFLKALTKAEAFRLHTIPTDNGQEFTDRLFGRRAKDASGTHELDALCTALGTDHQLTRPRTPKTNGMVERFNGWLSQVLRSHRFNRAEDLAATLHRYVWLYNEHLVQKALDHETPLQALEHWQASRPDPFVKAVRNRPGPDN